VCFADQGLARLLESSAARQLADLADVSAALVASSGATWSSLAGGVAARVGAGSGLLDAAIGMGLDGPVEADELDRVVGFFRDRGLPARVWVSPFADPSFPGSLAARGLVPRRFEQVLVMSLTGGWAGQSDGRDDVASPRPSDVTVSETADREMWGRLMTRGFEAPAEPTEDAYELGRVVASSPGTRLFVGAVGGEYVGTGMLAIDGTLARLDGDATLPEARGKGVQGAIQAARIAAARSAGCALVTTEATPGSGSQRNMERCGFRVAYTRMRMEDA
jgi:GNAT superfamily N-acetyltransferase